MWEDVPNIKAVDTLVDVAFGNGLFVGVGLHSLRIISRDGMTWEEIHRARRDAVEAGRVAEAMGNPWSVS